MAKFESARRYHLEVLGSPRDLGEYQHSILTLVSSGHFDEAFVALDKYKSVKRNYPQFAKRTDRLFDHTKDLINAIKTKRTIPNLSSMAQSKQEEVHLKTLENWEDLKLSLRRIRTIERDLMVADARSSIYVVRAIVFSVVVLMIVFVINEAFFSFGKSLVGFMGDTYNAFLQWLD